MTTTTMRQTVIQTALLTVWFQRLMRTAAADNSAGMMMIQLYWTVSLCSISRAGGKATHDVVPSDGKREGRVDESLGKPDVTSGNGEEGDHLSERDHDRVADGPHESISHEQTEGATVGEGVTRSKEETGTCHLSARSRVSQSGTGLAYRSHHR